MSYCCYCGRELKEGETCDCRQNIPVQNQQSTTNNRKKIGFIIGGCSTVLILGIIGIVLLLTRESYKKPVENVVALINKQETSIDNYFDVLTPDFVADAFSKIIKLAKKSEIGSQIEDLSDQIEEKFYTFDFEYGDDWKVSYKIKEEQEMTSRQLSHLKDTYDEFYYDELKDLEREISNLDDYYFEYLSVELDLKRSELEDLYDMVLDAIDEFRDINISKGYMLDVDFIIEGDYNRDINRSVDVPVVKINGKWVIDCITLMNELNYDFDGFVNF